MRQQLRKKSERNSTERKEEDFAEIKKKVTEIPCLEDFAGDQDKIVTTEASRTGLGMILWQKQNDNTIRPIAFASWYLDDAES